MSQTINFSNGATDYTLVFVDNSLQKSASKRGDSISTCTLEDSNFVWRLDNSQEQTILKRKFKVSPESQSNYHRYTYDKFSVALEDHEASAASLRTRWERNYSDLMLSEYRVDRKENISLEYFVRSSTTAEQEYYFIESVVFYGGNNRKICTQLLQGDFDDLIIFNNSSEIVGFGKLLTGKPYRGIAGEFNKVQRWIERDTYDDSIYQCWYDKDGFCEENTCVENAWGRYSSEVDELIESKIRDGKFIWNK